MKISASVSEMEEWAKSPRRTGLELAYMLCFLVWRLGRSASAFKGNSRWISNASKVIVTGLGGYEAALRFRRIEDAHIFDSAPLREILGELVASGMMDERCHRCDEPFAPLAGERIALWEHVKVPRCRRCGGAYDQFQAVFSLSDSGLEWMNMVEPIVKGSEGVITIRSMVLSSRVLFRDEISQFDVASDMALKLSELKAMERSSSSHHPGHPEAGAPMNEAYLDMLTDLNDEEMLSNIDVAGMADK